MYKIEMSLRYRLMYYIIVLIFICGLIMAINYGNYIMVLLAIPCIVIVYGITIAKWVVKADTLEFWAGYRYLKLAYSEIVDIYSYQSKLGIFANFAVYTENAVKLTYYNKKKEKIEFSFSLALDEREEFISIVKQRMQQSNDK